MADYKDGFLADGNVKNEKGKIVELGDNDDFWVEKRDGHII